MDDKDTVRVLWIVVAIFGLLFGFVSIWWWAIAGMSGNIGSACAATSLGLMLISGLGLLVTSENW